MCARISLKWSHPPPADGWFTEGIHFSLFQTQADCDCCDNYLKRTVEWKTKMNENLGDEKIETNGFLEKTDKADRITRTLHCSESKTVIKQSL